MKYVLEWSCVGYVDFYISLTIDQRCYSHLPRVIFTPIPISSSHSLCRPFPPTACLVMADHYLPINTSSSVSNSSRNPILTRHSSSPSAFIVIDTNFLLSHLTLIQSIQAWHSKYRHAIVLPWIVIEECYYFNNYSNDSERPKGK